MTTQSEKASDKDYYDAHAINNVLKADLNKVALWNELKNYRRAIEQSGFDKNLCEDPKSLKALKRCFQFDDQTRNALLDVLGRSIERDEDSVMLSQVIGLDYNWRNILLGELIAGTPLSSGSFFYCMDRHEPWPLDQAICDVFALQGERRERVIAALRESFL